MGIRAWSEEGVGLKEELKRERGDSGMEWGEGVGLKEGLKREREDSGMEWGEGVGLKEGLKRERERGFEEMHHAGE